MLYLVVYVYYCRYLIQISIRERYSHETSNFVCDKWLKPAAEQDITKCDLNVTKAQPFKYAFRVLSQQSMRDQHVWVSIFTCPQHSTFTRVQRLSCGFAIVTSSMLANIMFYKANSPAYDLLIFSELTINLRALIIGTQSAFIATPINALIMLIFRKVSVNKGAYIVRYGGDPSNPPYADDRYSSDNSSISDTTTEQSESDSSSHSSVYTYDDNRDISNGSTSSNSSISEDSAKTDAFALPWWFVWLAWTLTVATCLCSSFLVIAYGLSNTHYKNVAWTMSFFMSMLGHVGVIQPFKVAVLVMLGTLIFNQPVRPSFEASQLDNLGKYT